MSKIVDIETAKPHLSGTVVCFNCKHEWTAVSPVGKFEDLECPSCGLMKGCFKGGVLPDVFWECSCGCCLMTISGITKNIMCYQCGEIQSGFD